eukprot:3063659-Prymnesium_polylepis.1
MPEAAAPAAAPAADESRPLADEPAAPAMPANVGSAPAPAPAPATSRISIDDLLAPAAPPKPRTASSGGLFGDTGALFGEAPIDRATPRKKLSAASLFDD